MNQHVEFVKTKTVTTASLSETAFSFNKNKKCHWLQRAAIEILKRLGCSAVIHTQERDRVRFLPRHFMEALYEQRREIIQQYHNESALVLLIGDEDFSAMMNTPMTGTTFDFRAEYANNRTIHGMQVRVIPWMTGMLVVPGKYL